MHLLTLLSWLFFGGDVERLGHTDYTTRAEAHCRLWHAGPLAWPALIHGETQGNEERRHRCRLLLTKMPDSHEIVARAILEADTPPTWAARYLTDNPLTLAAICRRIDAAELFWCRDSLAWVQMLPHKDNSITKDIQTMLECVHGRRIALKLKQ